MVGAVGSRPAWTRQLWAASTSAHVGPGQDRIQHGVFGLIEGGQGEVHDSDRVALR